MIRLAEIGAGLLVSGGIALLVYEAWSLIYEAHTGKDRTITSMVRPWIRRHKWVASVIASAWFGISIWFFIHFWSGLPS